MRNAAGGVGAELDEVRALLRDAAAYWRGALLESRSAVQYLRSRGIGGAVAARFGLGYAPPRWRDLERVFASYSPAAVEASGLLCRRGALFRDRVIFPINAGGGELVGFGGRFIGLGEAPKYLNSPESALFRKRELLYGLDHARAAIVEQGAAIVVEGYLDTIALAQAGLRDSVATLGTACAVGQVRQLQSLAGRILFCFDGDAAGRAAAARALGACAPLARDGEGFGFVFLPSGHDPDSFVRDCGVVAFSRELQEVVGFFEFLLQVLAAGCDVREAEGRVCIAARAKRFWRAMPEGAMRAELLDYCASLLRMPTEDLADMWSAGRD